MVKLQGRQDPATDIAKAGGSVTGDRAGYSQITTEN